MQDYSDLEARLIARRDELRTRVDASEKALDQPGDPDVEEQASERQNDEAIAGVEEAALNEIKAIDAALGRMESGQYGHCGICGKEIPRKRLEAVPYAATCIDCA